eukprot:CAMPEP_0173462848 /NCGR_PEP_ID=MMETSP1357-20121228/67326_1 /TAXON_ID=77926 /ORGANISM="Hemiselmis rufescens, Strain PCC563" /LENGTH=105 /DNA_ID=CAMNT_0014430607 /DNA_START=41 /DNA_END=355 /DNA_ORIENTATION=-
MMFGSVHELTTESTSGTNNNVHVSTKDQVLARIQHQNPSGIVGQGGLKPLHSREVCGVSYVGVPGGGPLLVVFQLFLGARLHPLLQIAGDAARNAAAAYPRGPPP